MLHLRPGLRGDRRRRSDAPPTTGPELRIRALGRTQVEALDDSVHGDWLTQRPGRILKYLVTERSRVVLIDEIVEAIWPEAGPRAVANARYAIHRLRLKLEPRRGAHKPPAFVVSRGNGYALDRERVWIDADDFERAIDEGRAAMSRLDPASAAQHLERATALYRGPFLTDEPYAHWAVDERNRLAGMAIYALRVLTALAKERNDVPDAIGHLQRLSELEPLDGAVHRELCHALLAEGRRSEAKRRYVSFAARLRRELGEAPDFDLRSLASVDPEAQAPTPQ
jgi:DNA-binding SARP family transcriptional activator